MDGTLRREEETFKDTAPKFLAGMLPPDFGVVLGPVDVAIPLPLLLG